MKFPATINTTPPPHRIRKCCPGGPVSHLVLSEQLGNLLLRQQPLVFCNVVVVVQSQYVCEDTTAGEGKGGQRTYDVKRGCGAEGTFLSHQHLDPVDSQLELDLRVATVHRSIGCVCK
jgi:hypothetical protein